MYNTTKREVDVHFLCDQPHLSGGGGQKYTYFTVLDSLFKRAVIEVAPWFVPYHVFELFSTISVYNRLAIVSSLTTVTSYEREVF